MAFPPAQSDLWGALGVGAEKFTETTMMTLWQQLCPQSVGGRLPESGRRRRRCAWSHPPLHELLIGQLSERQP